ncbi:hypothetical protein SGL43_02963 [Streptomyces globisporus]|uniref:Uncharacterized protein n=1 Tax=Streptomyces globisporus TaxID=1908 RepID=A0ABM9GXV5_STRGL|nr:hypothetical protein SGL43_02963 [Streptomyces globisporus]
MVGRNVHGWLQPSVGPVRRTINADIHCPAIAVTTTITAAVNESSQDRSSTTCQNTVHSPMTTLEKTSRASQRRHPRRRHGKAGLLPLC